jgi:predicted ribosome quality control (RQC) complex YloA/Tae2 family protein
LIKQSASGGQNLARRITKLDLKHGAFTILLDDAHLAEDDNTQITAGVECEIDITQNAFQNARAHHDTRRWAAVKEQKTIVASKKALKSTKIKTEAALKQVQIKSAVSRQRRVYWFEKFYWFISADNYLVLGGRDAQQNEQLVRRHLKAGDAYVHADMRGCASVVVKNRSVRADAMDIPARTMHAAGVMAVVYSPAWDAKVVPNVWWVRHDQVRGCTVLWHVVPSSLQVTRTAPSGEYLTTGSFMIRGQKQFLPPAQLVMGFAFLFKLDDESVPAHRFDRVHSVTQSENGGTDSDNVEHTTEGETEEIVLSSSDDEAAVEDTIIDENESKVCAVENISGLHISWFTD